MPYALAKSLNALDLVMMVLVMGDHLLLMGRVLVEVGRSSDSLGPSFGEGDLGGSLL